MSIKKAVKRIYEFNPNIKLIFMLRNPVERTFSNYKREIQVWGESRSFEEIIKKSRRYLWHGKYYMHISKYLKFFSKEQMMFIIFEEFINEKEKYRKRICNFLGVNPKFIQMITI